MAELFTHDGNFGEQALGTREEFRNALAPTWADWHRDADTTLSLEDYIEQSLDQHLVPADEWDIEHVERISA